MRRCIAEGRFVAALWFWSGLFILAVATVAAAGCRKAGGMTRDISVQENITPQPVRTGAAIISIQLADSSAKPVTDATITLEGDMDHPGMSPIFGTATETAPGTYTAHLDFNMRGDWVVVSHIALADGRKLEHQIDVRGVESN